MLDRILLAFATAIIGFLERRAEQSTKATDAKSDRALLTRAANRILRMRTKDGTRS